MKLIARQPKKTARGEILYQRLIAAILSDVRFYEEGMNDKSLSVRESELVEYAKKQAVFEVHNLPARDIIALENWLSTVYDTGYQTKAMDRIDSVLQAVVYNLELEMAKHYA